MKPKAKEINDKAYGFNQALEVAIKIIRGTEK